MTPRTDVGKSRSDHAISSMYVCMYVCVPNTLIRHVCARPVVIVDIVLVVHTDVPVKAEGPGSNPGRFDGYYLALSLAAESATA